MPLSNPYRIPKPKQDILWRGTLLQANEKGKSKLGGNEIYQAVLTSTHLWLWGELAIPLTTITKITTLNQGGGAGIYFHQALIDQNLIAHVRMEKFFFFPDRKRMAVFTTLLLEARENALAQTPGQGSIHAVAEALRSEAKCEICGDPHAALLAIGWLFSFGVVPFILEQNWNPVRPYLCRKHAIRTTCWHNFITSLVGWLGFPGIFTGPFYVWKNAFQLKKTFPISLPTFLFVVLCGLLVPIVTLSALWIWISLNVT